MAHESIMHSATMGYKCCFTDHSLFGFADASSIHMNQLLKCSLSAVHHVICVSNTSKENSVLRAAIDPLKVSVIPNAVDYTKFTPDPSARSADRITIVVMSRLVYRKGIDLLIDAIPEVCRRHPQVDFLIGGDGPKMLALEEMREKHQLHERVTLLGSVKHSEVRSVLVQGHIFLNSSLTEAFCIAIVEAVSCGLLVISTKVGGVPEVLPQHMLRLCKPVASDMIDAISQAVAAVKNVVPQQLHDEVRTMYSWDNVAERTEVVYGRISEMESQSLIERLKGFYECGTWVGPLYCCVLGFMYLWWKFLEWYWPEDSIDIAPNFPYESYQRRHHPPPASSSDESDRIFGRRSA